LPTQTHDAHVACGALLCLGYFKLLEMNLVENVIGLNLSGC